MNVRVRGRLALVRAEHQFERGRGPASTPCLGGSVSEAFVGQIVMAPYLRPPSNWSFCSGQSQPIEQNQTLFALLGVQFGGDGISNFLLPNLNGRVVVGPGGANQYIQGQTGGATAATLTLAQLPAHSHTATFTTSPVAPTLALRAAGPLAATVSVTGQMMARDTGPAQAGAGAGMALGPSGTAKVYVSSSSGSAVPLVPITSTVNFTSTFTAPVTGSISVPALGTVTVGSSPPPTTPTLPTMPPYIALNSIIALFGMFPSQS